MTPTQSSIGRRGTSGFGERHVCPTSFPASQPAKHACDENETPNLQGPVAQSIFTCQVLIPLYCVCLCPAEPQTNQPHF